MSVTAIIPARMASSRFPGKPLKTILGMSMIEHVHRRVSMCAIFDDVIVATCDQEIVDEVESFGGKAVMTSDQHESCVDRVAEAAKGLAAEFIVNVQGDMPLIHPEALKRLVMPLLEEKIMFTDMMGAIDDGSEIGNINVVKVVFDLQGNALYYSRRPLPSSKDVGNEVNIKKYKQFGINAFHRDGLDIFTKLSRTPLEVCESVDMLRLLENGYKVRMVDSSYPAVGVDTSQDLIQVEKLMQDDPISAEYLVK